MMILKRHFKDLLLTSLFTVILFGGSWNLFVECLNTFLPFGLIFLALIVGAIYFVRVPPPTLEQVEAITGKELHLLEDNNTGFAMKTVAHRGAGLDAPENSLVAFKMCKEKTCETIEFDVALTQDNVPVVFHDETLERMTDLHTAVINMKYSDILNVDISVKHPLKDRFPKTNIPTLEQAVTQLLSSGQRMIIDLKDNNSQLIKVIHDLYKKYPELYSKAVVSSFYPNLIYFIRKGDPKIVCSMAWRPHAFAYDSFSYAQGVGQRRQVTWYKHLIAELCDVLNEWALPRVTYYILGLSIILLHKDVISGKTVLDWRKKGIRVMAWTANSPAEKQFFARVLKITYLTDTLIGEGTTHLAAS